MSFNFGMMQEEKGLIIIMNQRAVTLVIQYGRFVGTIIFDGRISDEVFLSG